MSEITEAQVDELVRVFYGRARQHPVLGPVFDAAISDWDHHLQVVQNFWSRVLLDTSRYKGHPYPAHENRGIQREHFEHWLNLFREVAPEVLPPAAADKAIRRAEHMADSFRAGLFPFDPMGKKAS